MSDTFEEDGAREFETHVAQYHLVCNEYCILWYCLWSRLLPIGHLHQGEYWHIM